jgi:ABC-type amino acid transport substrate-binding protein
MNWKIARKHATLVLVVLAVVMVAFCVPAAFAKKKPKKETLRVGVTPDYPPLIFVQGEKVAGIEADLARTLANRMGRTLTFRKVRWERQIDELLAGNIDIIMSGMSVTPPRQLRVQFCEPYLKNGLMTAVRRADASLFNAVEDITQTSKIIGVQSGTTGHTWVKENCPNARAMPVADPGKAAFELQRRRIDMYIHDGHAIAWMVSQNESDVAGIWVRLTEENIAWAVRRDDASMLKAANEGLEEMRKSGVLKRILDKWLPYDAEKE